MNKEQFLSYWSNLDSKELMSEHLDLYAKDVLEDNKCFMSGKIDDL